MQVHLKHIKYILFMVYIFHYNNDYEFRFESLTHKVTNFIFKNLILLCSQTTYNDKMERTTSCLCIGRLLIPGCTFKLFLYFSNIVRI